jgi:hypothetical protein
MFNMLLKVPFMWFFHNIYNTAYSGEITGAQRAGMAKATNASFSANNFTYYYTEPIGPDTDTSGAQPGDKLYIVRSHLVDPNNLTEEARRFSEYVRSGNAFTSATPGTTTTTTAATTTTTTTA